MNIIAFAVTVSLIFNAYLLNSLHVVEDRLNDHIKITHKILKTQSQLNGEIIEELNRRTLCSSNQ